MALIQKIPRKEDTELFTRIIEKNYLVWRDIGSKNQTKEDFLTQPLPKEDVQTPEVRYLNFCDNTSDIGLSTWTTRRLDVFCKEKGYISSTNSIVYNPMSYMKWHTNSNNIGYRHYYTFTTKEAIFRWIDPKTGKIHDEIDNKGWTYRVFKISNKDLLWHTIWTEGIRFSFGFNSNELET